VSAADAPSIYDIPKVLHSRGWTPTSPAGSGCRPRRGLERPGTTCLRRCTAGQVRFTIALVGKYVDLPECPIFPGRGAAGGGFANAPPGEHPVGDQR